VDYADERYVLIVGAISGEKSMPMKSKAQSRLMHAAAKWESNKVPAKVGKKFVMEQHGKSLKRLPERKTRK
jgi:hypothetical protein